MIRGTLMKHQEQLVNFALAGDKKYFSWFAAYGVGKTLATLSYIEKMNFNRSLIISSKTALASSWVDEIRRWTTFKVCLLIGTTQQKLASLDAGFRMSQLEAGAYHSGGPVPTIFLLNFDAVHSMFNYLVKWSKDQNGKPYPNGSYFDFMCVDESTKAKSPEARRTKVLWSLGKQIKYKSIMTGWPTTEGIQDIFSQIKILDQGQTLGEKYYDFMDKYFVRSGFDYVPKKDSSKKILNLIKPFSMQLTNKMLDLPPKLYKTINIEPTKQQLAVLEELKGLFRLEFGKVRVDTQFIFTVLTRCLQVCDGFIQDSDIKDSDGNVVWRGGNVEGVSTNKDEVLMDLLDEIDIYHNKVVIWFKFRYSLQKVEYLLKKAKIPVLSLIGGATNINWSVNTFQNPRSGYNVILATQKKASESITLTAARYSVYYSRDYSADLRYNSEARTYRKGSERWKGNSIIYTDLVTKDSIEETVMSCLADKKEVVDRLKAEFLAMSN